jgi:hypothetical protein
LRFAHLGNFDIATPLGGLEIRSVFGSDSGFRELAPGVAEVV